MWAAFGILLLAQGAMTAGIIMLVFAGLFTFFYFNWRVSLFRHLSKSRHHPISKLIRIFIE